MQTDPVTDHSARLDHERSRSRGRTTVVIPCYKDDRFLDQAIQSVASQTVPVARLVVVDDGSPQPLVERSASGSIEELVWLRTENRGLGAARNEGIRHAVGDFIAFLDADDHWDADKLHLQQERLDQLPSAVGCYTQCAEAPGYYGFGPYPSPDLPASQLAAKVWYGQFFPPSSLLVRRTICQQVDGFREGLVNGEDLDFLFRLFAEGNVVGISKPLTYYRVHDQQITSNVVRKVLGAKEARRGILERSSELLIEGGIPRSELWDAYRNSVLQPFYRRDFRSARVMMFDYWKEHVLDVKMFIYLLVSLLPVSWVTKLRGKTE